LLEQLYLFGGSGGCAKEEVATNKNDAEVNLLRCSATIVTHCYLIRVEQRLIPSTIEGDIASKS
jgi:hypothetical protein